MTFKDTMLIDNLNRLLDVMPRLDMKHNNHSDVAWLGLVDDTKFPADD